MPWIIAPHSQTTPNGAVLPAASSDLLSAYIRFSVKHSYPHCSPPGHCGFSHGAVSVLPWRRKQSRQNRVHIEYLESRWRLGHDSRRQADPSQLEAGNEPQPRSTKHRAASSSIAHVCLENSGSDPKAAAVPATRAASPKRLQGPAGSTHSLVMTCEQGILDVALTQRAVCHGIARQAYARAELQNCHVCRIVLALAARKPFLELHSKCAHVRHWHPFFDGLQ